MNKFLCSYARTAHVELVRALIMECLIANVWSIVWEGLYGNTKGCLPRQGRGEDAATGDVLSFYCCQCVLSWEARDCGLAGCSIVC
jgi:hypothetical protein